MAQFESSENIFNNIGTNKIEEEKPQKQVAPKQEKFGSNVFGGEFVKYSNQQLEQQRTQVENESRYLHNLYSPEKIQEWKSKGEMSALEVWNKKNKYNLIPYAGTVNEIKDVGRLSSITNQVQKGQVLSKEDKEFYEQFLLDMGEIQARGYTIGGNIVNIGLETLPFMVEFGVGLATTGGGASFGASVAKIGAKNAVKEAGKKIAKTVAEEVAENGILKTVGKGAAKTIYNSTINPQTTKFALTRLPQQVALRYGENQLSQQVAITPDGQLILQEAVDNPAIAFMKALALTNIEIGSEMSGDILVRPFLQGISAPLRAIISKMPKGFSKAFEEAVKKSTNLPFTKALDKFGFNGILEEMGEERVGDLLKFAFNLDEKEGYSFEQFLEAAFGGSNLKEIATNAISEAGAFALTGGAMNLGVRGLGALTKKDYTKDDFLFDSGILRTDVNNSILDNAVKNQMEKEGKTKEEVEQVLRYASKDDKIEYLKNADTKTPEQIKEDLAKDTIQKQFYDRQIKAGVSEEQALRNSEIARMMFASMGSNTEAKQKWFDNLFITKDVKVENSTKVAKQLFQSAEVAGSDGNIEEAKKEWQEKGTESKYFKKWFGKSVAKTITGKPLVLYHGTPQENGEFDTFKNSNKYYFSTKEQYAKYFAEDFGANDGLEGKVFPVYLSIQKPLNLTKFKNKNVSAEEFIDFLNKKDITLSEETIEAINNLENKSYTPIFRYTRLLNDSDIEQIKSKGYDGITQLEENEFKNKNGAFEKIDDKAFIVFDNTQIKSVNNQGTFDGENANIYFQKDRSNANKNIELNFGMTSDEIISMIKEDIKNILDDNYIEDTDFNIEDMRIFGSYSTNENKDTSDLDILVQYSGAMREDDAFNILNEEKLTITDTNGKTVNIDINPINVNSSGTIDEYLDRVDKQVDIDGNNANIYHQTGNEKIDNSENYKNLPKDLKEAVDYIYKGESVYNITGEEFPNNGEDLNNRVFEYYKNNFDNKITNSIGEIKLDKRSIKDSIYHGINTNKINAFAAVPYVLQNGRMLNVSKENNDEKRFLFVAPITLRGDDYYCEVIVKSNKDRQGFYIHEIELKEKLVNVFPTSQQGTLTSSKSIIADLINKYNPNVKNNKVLFQDSIDQNQFDIDLIQRARTYAEEKYNEAQEEKFANIKDKDLSETQKRYRDTAYNIIWHAISHKDNAELSKTIKNKKQLPLLLGNVNQAQNSKVTIKTREKLEFLLRELEDEISKNGKDPEWDEFFDTTVSDAELAYRAYEVITNKEYLSDAFDENAGFKRQEEAIEKNKYEFDYLIQEFKNAYKNKNQDLMDKLESAFYTWANNVDETIIQDVIDNWYEKTNRIKRNENLGEETLAKGYGEYLGIHNDKKKQNELKYRGYYAKIGEKSLINIMSGSDASTIIHELAHFFLTGLNEMAKIDEDAREKLELINKWLKVDGSGIYNRAQEEKFAGSFEAYLYTGKAPTSKMRQVFEWFKNVLKEIYWNVSMIQDAEISQEAQDLFDKIFSEEEFEDKRAYDIYSKVKNIRVDKNKITNKDIENKLDETQLRHRKACYDILSRATGKSEKYLKLILENKKESKNVGEKIAELENEINNVGSKISNSGDMNPEWLEFFDDEKLFTSGNDQMLAKEAFLTILNKTYRSYASVYDFEDDLEAQYNYLIKQYKDIQNRTSALGAYYLWLDNLKLEEEKEFYNEKFNNDANTIERYENLDEIEKSKLKVLHALEFYNDVQDLSKEEKYKKQIEAIISGLKFLNVNDKAKLTTNILDVPNKSFTKARLNELFDIAETMQDVNERRILAKKISDEINSTKNIKRNDKMVGKYDYRTNKFFEQLRDFNKLTQEAAQETLQTRREAINADEGISFEDKFVNKFLSFKANGLNYTDTHTLQSMYDDILKIKKAAKNAKDEIDFVDKLNNEKAKEEVIEVLHNVKANPKFGNDIIKWMGNLYSSMNYLFNKNIAEKYSMEYLNTKTTTWIENEKRKFKDAVQEIYGRNNWNWRDDIINNTNEIKQHIYYKYTLDPQTGLPIVDKEIPIKLNKMHYILAYIWNKNKVLSERLEKMFGKEQLEEMLGSLTVQDERLGDFMVSMTTSYYHQVNKIYIEKFGLDMPRVNAYFPSRVEIDKISEFDLLNDFTSQSLGRSFIKQRVNSDNITMDFNNPVEILMSHISNVGKFINEGIEIDKINKIFLDKRVKREVINKFDEKAYKILTDNLADITYKNHAQEYSKANEKFGEYANNFIGANVMVKPTIVLKQLLSMTNYSVDMPYDEWFKGLAHALSHPKQTIDFMMKIPYLRARFESGGQNEALKDFMKFNYAKLKNAKFNARLATMKEYLSLNVRYGDIGAIIFGGKPYYDYLIKQGLTKEEAEKKFIESTVRSQQSSEVSTLSAFQRDASKKGANRLFTAYRNASIQYIRALDDAFVQYQRGEIDTKKLSKVIFNFLILQPYLYAAVGSGTVLQWILGNGDFIDVLIEILHSIPNGLLGGFGLLGDLAKDIINKVIFGEKVYQSTIPVIADLQRDIQILFKEDLSFEDVIKALADISKITTGLPLDSITNMAGGVGDIATGEVGKGVLRVAGYTKNRAEKITGEK